MNQTDASLLTCTSYTPSQLGSPTPVTTTTSTTGGAPPQQLWTIPVTNNGTPFHFNSQQDASLALGILANYSAICILGPPNDPSQEAMVLEPVAALPPLSSGEHCTAYNNNPLTLQARPSGNGHLLPFLIDSSVTPTPPPLQVFDNPKDASAGRDIALAHSRRCWIGGSATQFSTLDAGDGASILEYWR
jgi:hypothetical protein